MSKKLKKIKINSPVTITYLERGIYSRTIYGISNIIEGTVIEVIGDTIKVKILIWRLGFIKVFKYRWFSFNNSDYKINVKNIDNS